MAKSTTRIPFWVIPVGILIILALWMVGQYNTLVALDVEVDKEWSNVEVQYQRRADLVPQLVATVEGAADFESSTLQEVTEARTNWLDTQADPNAGLDEQIAAANSFDSALSRLLVTVEAYPTLTATENFQTLQAELAGTENRVSIAREDYNEAASNYNLGTRRIPMSLFARAFGFDPAPLFDANEGSEDAPTVEFDFGN